VQQGRFPAAIRAQQREAFTGFNGEGDAGDARRVPRIGEMNIINDK
jgi:hypothetical protein